MVKQVLKLRNVELNDISLIYQWANDEIVRKNSFNMNKITWDEHQKWFSEILNDFNTKFFVLTLGNEPIGQIRIKLISQSIFLISFSIEKRYRGMSYGHTILMLLEEKLREEEIMGVSLRGEVKLDNIASHNVFIKAGYKMKFCDEHKIVYEKRIDVPPPCILRDNKTLHRTYYCKVA